MSKKSVSYVLHSYLLWLKWCYQATVNLVSSGNYYLMGDGDCRRYVEKDGRKTDI